MEFCKEKLYLTFVPQLRVALSEERKFAFFLGQCGIFAFAHPSRKKVNIRRLWFAIEHLIPSRIVASALVEQFAPTVINVKRLDENRASRGQQSEFIVGSIAIRREGIRDVYLSALSPNTLPLIIS